ncbi:MAG: glycoside hydrolase [Acidobacteria bacterium]|nr:glycoside hydrolase [Acidobacteriota bacterium]MBI3655471.1 glycoside hydrolase [Acidobacteriota bacterium]
MIILRSLGLALCISLALAGLLSAADAQPFRPSLYQSLRWRMIGPFRGGRTVGATGVPGQPNVFYIGVNNGGVWKTNDYGRTWTPIFDDQPTGSIGALAVAPSNPNIIYVGSGEGLQRPDLSVGDGIYKSTDAGQTWRHLGLRDGQQIPAIIVDPINANRLFVAVLGHPYGANAERGVFRSTDGAETWQKVLYKNENTGAMELAFDPNNPQIIYAVLWESRQGPWENAAWSGPGSGLYKSIDGGNTWRPLTKGLPASTQGLGRIGLGIAPSQPSRLYATVDAGPLGGIYRSDDAGESWQRINTEARLWGRGSDFAEIKVHTKNPDTLYVANTSTYRSTDGGQTFAAIKGAPGGDDYHRLWINPDNPQIILLAGDQGAIITVNGGETWSSWYNQPTAQFYHVITDQQFPYWVYGAQQESGSAAVVSRGDYGAITARDWRTVGVEEYGYVAPDPLNPNIIYGGKISRFDRTTGQAQNISPEAVRRGKYRFLRTAPVIFSPIDPHILYFAGNVLFKTTNGGHHWETISPDLSRAQPETPASIGVYRTSEHAPPRRRGVIYTIAPSFRDVNMIWAGTDDGLIHVTRDGGHTWKDVTPPDLTAWSKVSLMEASHFDAETAYAAINRFRLDDLHPYIYRTRDGGQTWEKITKGIPANEVVNVVREDPQRRGLLLAGTERAVYVSFNDGGEWQSLRHNMPATSIRDLVIYNDDVVVGTHGRSFWIMDNITPLRQINQAVAASDVHLFRPQQAYRVRRSLNTDTPIPPDEPMGKNPPDGAIIDYYLKSAAAGPVTLEIINHAQAPVIRYSIADAPQALVAKELDIPTHWVRPPQILSAAAGMHRFVWDLHYTPPAGPRRSYPISAIYRDTPSMPMGPVVLPGEYTVKLTVNGRSYTQPLTVKMDPRVKTPPEGLAQMFALAMRSYEGIQQVQEALAQVQKLKAQLKERGERAGPGALGNAIAALEHKVAALAGDGGTGGPRAGGPSEAAAVTEPSLTRLNRELRSLLELVESADATPTTQAVEAAAETHRVMSELLARWHAIKTTDVKALNEQLRRAKRPLLVLEF